jgi:hypothetical protein
MRIGTTVISLTLKNSFVSTDLKSGYYHILYTKKKRLIQSINPFFQHKLGFIFLLREATKLSVRMKRVITCIIKTFSYFKRRCYCTSGYRHEVQDGFDSYLSTRLFVDVRCRFCKTGSSIL